MEWLLDEPGLEAPDCGFFICMKKATIIMNLRRRRGGGGVGGGGGHANGNGPAAAWEGGKASRGGGAEASRAAAAARRRAARASAHIIIMKNMVLSVGAWFPVVVSPNASDSPSKHCVPVHTVWLSRVLSSSCMPGRCGPFWQMQFMRSSHIVMAPTCGARRGELSRNAAESEV